MAAHFGLGKLDACDIEVILPHGKGKLESKGVKANQRSTMFAVPPARRFNR
jgi:hypothetical protein